MQTEQPREWQEACLQVTQQMRLVMMPFVTPLARVDADGATHVGSGGYVEYAARKFLLTNDHVVREGRRRLTHKFYDSDCYFDFPKAFASESPPIDLAASPVDLTWSRSTHSAMTFPEHRFAEMHAPVERELLFMLGFAGTRAYYSPSSEVLVTNGTPYLSQEFDPATEGREIASPGFDPNYHFAMPWRPEETQRVDQNNNTVVLDPKGFSGSFVWNTRYVEYTSAGKPWDPAVGRLTGIVWAWPTEDRALLVTRIEHVRGFLARIP